MKDAERHLLAVTKICAPDVAKHYHGIHKQMVRHRREWNKLEQKRERHDEPLAM